MRFPRSCLSSVTSGGQSPDVVLRPGSEDQRNRQKDTPRQAAAAQHKMDKRSPGPAIAINKWMDSLELGMCDGSLRHGGQCVIITELAKIIKEFGHEFRRRRDEHSGTRVVVATPYPVLLCADSPGMLGQSSAGKKFLVESENMVQRDVIAIGHAVNGGGHRINVRDDLASRNVARLLTKLLGSLGAKQTPRPDFQSLDPRRGD